MIAGTTIDGLTVSIARFTQALRKAGIAMAAFKTYLSVREAPYQADSGCPPTGLIRTALQSFRSNWR